MYKHFIVLGESILQFRSIARLTDESSSRMHVFVGDMSDEQGKILMSELPG